MTTKRKRDKRGSRSRTTPVKREDEQVLSAPDEDTPPPRKPNTFEIDIAHPLFRLYAYLTDIFILYVIIIVTKQIFGDNIWYPEAAPQDIGIILGYFVIPTALWGRTPGKWLTGLVVVDKEGYTAGLAAIPREIFGRAIASSGPTSTANIRGGTIRLLVPMWCTIRVPASPFYWSESSGPTSTASIRGGTIRSLVPMWCTIRVLAL